MSFGPRGVALSIERIKGAAPFIAQSVLAMRVKLSMATSILVIIVTSARQWPVLPPVSHTRGGDQGNLGNLGSLCGGHDRRCRFWSVLELLAHSATTTPRTKNITPRLFHYLRDQKIIVSLNTLGSLHENRIALGCSAGDNTSKPIDGGLLWPYRRATSNPLCVARRRSARQQNRLGLATLQLGHDMGR